MVLRQDLQPTPEALPLAEELRQHPLNRTGTEVVQLLQAWKLELEEDAIVKGAWFAIHPLFTHLQMDVPSLGRVHSYVVTQALGLVDSLRVRLASVTHEERLNG